MKNNKAFTLVELLAVIVILAVILVIAVPQVLDVIDTTKIGSLESSAKLIASTAEKKYAEYLALGKATVTIKGKDDGKFDGLKCEGTKDNMVCGDIPPLPVINCTFTPSEDNTIKSKLYTVKDYDACMTNLRSTIIDEMGGTEDILNGICSGTGDGYVGSTSQNIEWIIVDNYFTEQELIDLNVINAEEIDVYEYVNGQYTYRYGQEYGGDDWYTIDNDGWGVTLTDKASTEPVTSEVCTYINDKPIVSMSSMFEESAATSIDLSSFDTSNVTNMSFMFSGSAVTSLNLSSFNTSNVTNMSGMFMNSAVTSLDLSNFDTSNVTSMHSMFMNSAVTSLDLSNFDTSNVTSMHSMFWGSAAISLDLSSFDTSKVTDMSYMFQNSSATTGYARTQTDADKFNSSDGKPSTLTFVVKES